MTMVPHHGQRFELKQDLSAAARALLFLVAAELDRGDRVFCPICEGSWRMFLPFGVGGRLRRDAICPGCGSLERDRAAWLQLGGSEGWLVPEMRLLHIAPEHSIEPHLRRRLGANYVTADLVRTDVDARLSVEELPFEDGQFDAIICNHVLEHVENDRRALSELRRVLTTKGWALLQVPIDQTRLVTDEDPTVTSPRERRLRFGQHDHVRYYGRDYVSRLRAAGFEPQLSSVRERYEEHEIRRHGLDRHEVLHFCRLA